MYNKIKTGNENSHFLKTEGIFTNCEAVRGKKKNTYLCLSHAIKKPSNFQKHEEVTFVFAHFVF